MKRLIGSTILLVLIFGLSLLSPAAVEAFAGMLPAVTSLLAAIFAGAVFIRWRQNRRRYLLFWGIGLTFYALGTAMEAFYGFFGWQPWAFKLYYLSGALLTAAWLRPGMIQLLGRHWVPKVTLVLLSLGTLYGFYEVTRADLEPAFMSERLQSITASDIPAEELLTLAGQTVATSGGALMDVWARTLTQEAGINVEQVTESPERMGYGLRKGDAIVGTRTLMGQQGIDLSNVPASPASKTPFFVARNGKVHGYIGFAPALELNGSAIVRTTSSARSVTPFFNIFGTLALTSSARWHWLAARSTRRFCFGVSGCCTSAWLVTF